MRSALSSVALFASFALAGEPTIVPAMRKALDGAAPGFVPWKTADYTPAVRKDAADRKSVPWALELDVNKDGRTDLLLDGHDKVRSLRLCLVSKGAEYRVVPVDSAELAVPSRMVSYDEGRKAVGLSYFLWPMEDRKGFTLGIPQSSDAKGELLTDGSSTDFRYVKGRFEGTSQEL